MKITPPAYRRRPESTAGVDAIQYTDDTSGRRIVDWIDPIRGRGAAVYEEGSLIVPAVEFGGKAVWVPRGWVVYREFLSRDFHVAPKELFDRMYELRA